MLVDYLSPIIYHGALIIHISTNVYAISKIYMDKNIYLHNLNCFFLSSCITSHHIIHVSFSGKNQFKPVQKLSLKSYLKPDVIPISPMKMYA